MSVQSQINRIKANVAAAYTAAQSKGATMPPQQNSANLAAAINSISANQAADYVVETGTSGKWAYRKWASGIGECWATLGFTSLAVSNAWGSIYYATWMNSEVNKNGRKYPFDFVEEPTVTASPGRGSNDYWLVTDTANNTGTPLTHAPAFCIARASAGTVTSPQVAYSVVGRWK